MSLKEKLTLCIICKNDIEEVEKLQQMLDSVKEYVGKIEATITLRFKEDTPEPALWKVLTENGARVTEFVWVNDFSKARNFNLKQAITPYVLWLDCDDILKGGEFIEDNLKLLEKRQDITAIWYLYEYDFDEDGNCITVLPRERIFRREWHYWQGRIHENAFCKYRHLGYMENRIKVIHNNKHIDIEKKAIRNLKVSLNGYKEEKEKNNVDPRSPYDCARALTGVGDLEKAQAFFLEFLNVTRSDSDRYDALIRISDNYIALGLKSKAFDAAVMAMDTKEDWPDAYISLGKLAFIDGLYKKALHWFEIAETKSFGDKSGLPYNPLKYTANLWILKAEALWFENKPKESLELINKAFELKPNDELLKLKKTRNEDFLNLQRGEEGALILKDLIEEEKDEKKLKKYIDALPKLVSDHPVFVRLRNKFYPEEGRNRIVFYCHRAFEDWGPDSINTGIGGSEEATINLAKELAKIGWRVEVFNQCKSPGVFENVSYNHYDQYDRAQPCEIFISWRFWEYLKFAPADSIRILWLHDKQDKVMFPHNFNDMCDKIFTLSNHHRQDMAQFPDHAFYITRNGIDPSHFNYKVSFVRDDNKYIYASSPDRGLHLILDNWEKIREFNPKAELHVFYGFTKTYDTVRTDQAGKEYKETILDLMERLEGVTYHGRVGHKELAEWFLRCGFWLYPSVFTEISCITGMKAMAAGCWPVTNDLAALKETMVYGSMVKGEMGQDGVLEQWLNAVKEAGTLATPQKRQEMRQYALENLSWERLAEEWSEQFKKWRERKCQGTQERQEVEVGELEAVQ